MPDKNTRKQPQPASGDSVFEKIKSELREVKRAKWSVMFIAVCVAVATWRAAEQIHSAEINAKNATIENLQAKAHESKIQEEEIEKWRNLYNDALEHEWPPLTDAQLTEWAVAFAPTGVKTIKVYWGPDVKALRLFQSLKKLENLIGCKVTAEEGSAGDQKINVVTLDGDNSGPVAVRLLGMFKIPVKLETGPAPNRNELLIFFPAKL